VRSDRRQLRAVATAAAACALGLAGCGSHAATKQDVIARGNQICDTAAAAVRAVPPPAGTSTQALARYYEQVLPIVDKEASQLQALPRPAQNRSTLKAYVDAIAASVTAYHKVVAAAQQGDSGTVASESAKLRASPAAGLAQLYGMTDCARSPGTSAS